MRGTSAVEGSRQLDSRPRSLHFARKLAAVGMTKTAAWLLLVPIVLAYGYLAVGYARATPRWNNPDEPAHVNVVRQIATTGTLPVLAEGDWDQSLLDRLTSSWFPNDYEVEGIRYEGHQPPLYYLLAAPVYRLTLDMPLS